MSAVLHLARRLAPLLALALSAVIVAALIYTRGVPYTGAVWESDGRVFGVEAGGAAYEAGLRIGDRIIDVDGAPAARWPEQVGRAFRAGEPVAVTVMRDGQRQTIDLAPDLFPLAFRLSPLIGFGIALAFTILSLVVVLSGTDRLEARLFFWMGQLWAATMAAGTLMTAGVPGMWEAMGVAAGLLTPVMVHFHAVFPERRWIAARRWLLAVLYAIGLIVALRWLPWPLPYHSLDEGWPVTVTWLGLGIAASLGLIVAAYVRALSPGTRQRIRLVVLGTIVGLGPFGLLTMLLGRVSGLWTMPLVLLVPATYAAAVWRYNLMGFDRALNRGLVYLLVTAGLFAAYSAALTVLNALLPSATAGRAALGAIAALAAALTLRPLRDGVQRGVDRLFYGGWYDYRRLVDEVGQALARTLDQEALAEVLVRRVPAAMHLPGAALALVHGSRPQIVAQAGLTAAEVMAAIPAGEPSAGDIGMAADLALVPLAVEGRPLGWWLLAGRRREGWSPEDRRILVALGRQAALAAYNVRLIAELRAKVAEVEEMHHRLLAAREEERASLARELHDGVIQELIGLRYRLEAIEEGGSGSVEQVHEQVGVLIGELRRLCSDLRPPVLDQLGLAAALRTLAREMTALGLPVAPSVEEVTLPEGAAIGLYRIGQEALSNARRHAHATCARIVLAQEPGAVRLVVADDGCGFDPAGDRPAGSLGLLGMAERAQALGGRLEVDSAPGAGTRVTAWCPIAER